MPLPLLLCMASDLECIFLLALYNFVFHTLHTRGYDSLQRLFILKEIQWQIDTIVFVIKSPLDFASLSFLNKTSSLYRFPASELFCCNTMAYYSVVHSAITEGDLVVKTQDTRELILFVQKTNDSTYIEHLNLINDQTELLECFCQNSSITDFFFTNFSRHMLYGLLTTFVSILLTFD